MNPDSEVFTVVLRKENPNQAWGFRLQGGCDFTTPLSVQSVNPGGVAERCGLKSEDAVLKINEKTSDVLEHEEAKRMILMAGQEVTMVVQRGAVRVWKPKITPLSELRSNIPGSDQMPQETNGDSEYRVSLAADKQEFTPIGSSHNRSARPFPGFGGGSAPVAAPVAVHPQQSHQYNSNYTAGTAAQQYSPPTPPTQQYSPPTPPAAQQYGQPAPAAQQYRQPGPQEYGQPGLGANMGSLSLSDENPDSVPSSRVQLQVPPPPPAQVPQHQSLGPPQTSSQNAARLSPTFRAIQDAGGLDGPKLAARPVSPKYAALQAFTESAEQQEVGSTSLQAPVHGAVRSVSPTLRLIQQEEGKSAQEVTSVAAPQSISKPFPGMSAIEREAKDGEEMRYHGYVDENKQSKAFKILQSELEQGHEPPSRPSGMRSVRAPTTKPPGERSQNQQYNTCKACGTLIVGVFVRVSGDPLHPECFKCVDCGKNLKNHGHFNVNGKLYCDVHARTAAQPPAPDMYATPVYR